MLHINTLKFFKLNIKLKTSIHSDISEKIRNKYKIKKNHFWLSNLIFRKILKRKTGIFCTIFPSQTGKETILNQRNAICNYGKRSWNILYRNILNKYEGMRSQNIHKVILATSYQVYPAFPGYEPVTIPGSQQESRSKRISTVYNYGKGTWNILYRNILNKYEGMRSQNIHKVISVPSFPKYHISPYASPGHEYVSNARSWKFNGFQGFENPKKFSRELHYKSPEPVLIKASKPDTVEPEDEKSRSIKKTISENNNHLSNKEQEQEIEKIAERVYDLIEKKIEIEKDRRGLF